MNWFELFIIIYVPIIIFMGVMVFFAYVEGIKFLLLKPKEIQNRTKLNSVVCWIIWVLEFVLIPYIWVVILLVDFIKCLRRK